MNELNFTSNSSRENQLLTYLLNPELLNNSGFYGLTGLTGEIQKFIQKTSDSFKLKLLTYLESRNLTSHIFLRDLYQTHFSTPEGQAGISDLVLRAAHRAYFDSQSTLLLIARKNYNPSLFERVRRELGRPDAADQTAVNRLLASGIFEPSTIRIVLDGVGMKSKGSSEQLVSICANLSNVRWPKEMTLTVSDTERFIKLAQTSKDIRIRVAALSCLAHRSLPLPKAFNMEADLLQRAKQMSMWTRWQLKGDDSHRVEKKIPENFAAIKLLIRLQNDGSEAAEHALIHLISESSLRSIIWTEQGLRSNFTQKSSLGIVRKILNENPDLRPVYTRFIKQQIEYTKIAPEIRAPLEALLSPSLRAAPTDCELALRSIPPA